MSGTMKGEGVHVVEAGQELETCIRASIPRHLVLQMQTRVAKRTHDEMCNKEKPRVHLNYENQVRLGLVSLLRAWRGSMNDRNPVDLLANILASRGYRTSHILPKLPGKDSPEPNQHRLKSYSMDIMDAVRLSNLDKLAYYHSIGHSMLACNKFSESILHTACRRSSLNVIEYLLLQSPIEGKVTGLTLAPLLCQQKESESKSKQSNASFLPDQVIKRISWDCLVDDCGRSPMHDACWRAEPLFSVVALLLDHNANLLLFQDTRGSTPLHYVRREHWGHWCAFLIQHQDKYWPMSSLKNQEGEGGEGP